MQAVAALRGQFGGHQVMTVAEGEKLRQGEPPTAGRRRPPPKPTGAQGRRQGRRDGRRLGPVAPSSHRQRRPEAR